jgi:hypothetical protein
MKHVRDVLIAVVLVVCLVALAHASPGDCEQINDADQRHFCLAQTKHDKGECEQIKNHDLRYECRARVSK